MDEHLDFWEEVRIIRTRDNRYKEDAYLFLMEAVEYTVSSLEERRHVSGGELLEGITDFARKKYGLLAYSVLESWGVETTADCGVVVFHLVEAGILAKRECDTIDEFDDVFDLQATLERDYLR